MNSFGHETQNREVAAKSCSEERAESPVFASTKPQVRHRYVTGTSPLRHPPTPPPPSGRHTPPPRSGHGPRARHHVTRASHTSAHAFCERHTTCPSPSVTGGNHVGHMLRPPSELSSPGHHTSPHEARRRHPRTRAVLPVMPIQRAASPTPGTGARPSSFTRSSVHSPNHSFIYFFFPS